MMLWPLMKNTITFSDKLHLTKFIWSTNMFTNGNKVREFENNWSDWLGVKHSLFVTSGSTANFLLLAAAKELYGWNNNTKVLVPGCTWMTNVSPIIQLGMKPIFCDINLDNYSFDIQDLQYIRKKHKKIDCIFMPHLLGFHGEYHAAKTIFPESVILEDICESHGVRDKNGVRCGGKSLGSTFSFYYGHHMTTVEGGMVSTNNDDLYNLMKMKRSHGMAREAAGNKYNEYVKSNPEVDGKFLFVTDGYNFRNHEIPAVLGIQQLKRLDSMIKRRQENFEQFLDVVYPYRDYLILPKRETYDGKPIDSSYAFPIVFREPLYCLNLKTELGNNGIETRPIIAGNLLKHPAFRKYELTSNKKEYNIDIINRGGLYIGNNHFIGKKQFKALTMTMETILR